MRCFLGKFKQLTKILHGHGSRRWRQISILNDTSWSPHCQASPPCSTCWRECVPHPLGLPPSSATTSTTPTRWRRSARWPASVPSTIFSSTRSPQGSTWPTLPGSGQVPGSELKVKIFHWLDLPMALKQKILTTSKKNSINATMYTNLNKTHNLYN